MNDELIQAQVSATRFACRRMTALHLKALHDSVEQAYRVPAAFHWDRKAAAHAGRRSRVLPTLATKGGQ
jgi:hypothetical protein